MMRQTQVIIRPEHDPLQTVNDNDGVLRLGDRFEVRIQADRLQFTGFRELTALFEEGDLLQLLCIHNTSAEWRSADPHIAMSLNGLN
jgi:hypothetical protein